MSTTQYAILAAILPRLSDRDLEEIVRAATQILLRRRESPIEFRATIPFRVEEEKP